MYLVSIVLLWYYFQYVLIVYILHDLSYIDCFGPSLSHGFIWSTTQVNETARMQCSEIRGVFWSGLYASRKCLNDGVWDEVDMSQCTIKNSDELPFIVYSLYLEMPEHINSSFLTLNQVHNYVLEMK